MTYQTTPKYAPSPPQQAPLPAPTEDDERQIEESIKIERNSKGYNWSFRLKRLPGEDPRDWVIRCGSLDTILRARFAGPFTSD